MVDIDKLKPGDVVVTLEDDEFLPLNMPVFKVPAGTKFQVDCPVSDGGHCVRILSEKAASGVFCIHETLVAKAESDSSYPPCTCNLWFGCKCGAFQREREAANR